MKKSKKWIWYGRLPIIILFTIYIIALIIYREWTTLIICGLIALLVYVGYKWGKYCLDKEFEAKRKEEGEIESYY